MSKTVLANITGWTPAIDSITAKHGAIASLVFGRIWRYCQGSEGACTAALETIATELGLSRKTVERKVRILVNDEYLRDETPGVRYTPHRYFDTGKAGIEVSITADGETLSPEGKTESLIRSDLKSHVGKTESLLKREVKKEYKKESREGGFIFGLYEQYIGGIIPPGIMQEMSGAEDDYPAEQLEAAFKIAADNNKRSWSYVRGILRRFKQQGFTPPSSKPTKNADNNIWSGAKASNVQS